LLADKDTHARLSRQAIEYAQQYDWCQIVERVSLLYEEAIEARTLSQGLLKRA
jgi:hypothetical protein